MIFFKQIGLSLCFIMIFLVATACSLEESEDAMKKVKSTDLSNERIADIKLGISIIDEKFITQHGRFEPYPANNHYASQRNYDQYWNEQIILGVDRETKETLEVGVLKGNDTSSSVKGIKLGGPIDDVISAYGENFYTFKDREQGLFKIGYVDHQKNLNLVFLHYDGKVTGINFGYTFDIMEWEKQ